MSGPGRNGADNSRRQPDNAPTVPPKVRIAIAASIEASNSPSGEDKSGGFHEEGGYWGRDASGNLVVVPAQPGGNADPRTGDTKATVDVMKAVEPSQASKVATVEGTWHVHPKGETWVRGSKFKFEQGPSHDDINNATAPINVVVGARWKQVRFFNSTGQVGQAQSLNRFLEDK